MRCSEQRLLSTLLRLRSTGGLPAKINARICHLAERQRADRPTCSDRSPSGLRGRASTECLLSPSLDFFFGEVLQVRCDCPDEPERVPQLAVAVAPELISYWRYDFATSSDGLRPRSIGIR